MKLCKLIGHKPVSVTEKVPNGTVTYAVCKWCQLRLVYDGKVWSVINEVYQDGLINVLDWKEKK